MDELMRYNQTLALDEPRYVEPLELDKKMGLIVIGVLTDEGALRQCLGAVDVHRVTINRGQNG